MNSPRVIHAIICTVVHIFQSVGVFCLTHEQCNCDGCNPLRISPEFGISIAYAKSVVELALLWQKRPSTKVVGQDQHSDRDLVRLAGISNFAPAVRAKGVFFRANNKSTRKWFNPGKARSW